MAVWLQGDVARGRELIEQAVARAIQSGHVQTKANAHLFWTRLEAIRGDAKAVLPVAESLVALCLEYGLALYLAYGKAFRGWARVRLGDREAGAREMREGMSSLADQGTKLYLPLIEALLAEIEAEMGENALSRIDGALASATETGEHWSDSLLHRVRGEILLKVGLANVAPAEETFQTALAIAREQGARSWALRAALALAKLYQSTSRTVEAHAILAPVLEGFSPTPEMPEIAEAQALLAALAETGEVKNAAASSHRRLQLQTSYSKALMLSRGWGSEEAKAAFARAQELAKAVDNAAERFDAYYGLFAGSLVRGELRLARATAETFLREAEKEQRTTEAAAACRSLGTACLYQGDLAVARAHFEQALRIFDPERDREGKFRFGTEAGVSATVYLAVTNWLLGEAGPARKQGEEAIARAVESAHAPTLANAYTYKALFDAFRNDAEAARRVAESLLEVSRAHGLGLYLAMGALFSGWASARLGDRVTGMTELRQALAAYADQGNKLHAPFFRGRLAEFEAAGQDAEGALAQIDDGLALAERTGERWTDAFLHRIRGDILLKADPGHPARAEEAYLAAVTIAREQGARSFGLRAALALAKLYQSTSRPVEAHAILAPALEGFSPTREMPEIAEAMSLSARLA
jgi:predicted ATPase